MNTKLLDPCRLLAAIFVIAIHTSPLSSFCETGDFLFTRCIARTAVPFFFMLTGYFLLPAGQTLTPYQKEAFVKREKKLLLIYLTAIFLYLPLNFYSGQWDFKHPIRFLLFDATFYHLWYLPAAMLGLVLVFAVLWSGFKILQSAQKASTLCLLLGLLLYIPGLLGDSYYGCIQNIPALKAVYDMLFEISSYTRNGIFFAPVFISLGFFIKNHAPRIRRYRVIVYGTATLGLFAGLCFEGQTLHRLLWQRHDSMYILLVPLMYVLFQFLLCLSQKIYGQTCPLRQSHDFYGDISLTIYIIHPWVIVLIRGFARQIHQESLLVHQSLIHFLAVTVVSCILSVILWKIKQYSPITAFMEKLTQRR